MQTNSKLFIACVILVIFACVLISSGQAARTISNKNSGWIELPNKTRIRVREIVAYYEAPYEPILTVDADKMTEKEKEERMGTHILFQSDTTLKTTVKYDEVDKKVRETE